MFAEGRVETRTLPEPRKEIVASMRNENGRYQGIAVGGGDDLTVSR